MVNKEGGGGAWEAVAAMMEGDRVSVFVTSLFVLFFLLTIVYSSD